MIPFASLSLNISVMNVQSTDICRYKKHPDIYFLHTYYIMYYIYKHIIDLIACNTKKKSFVVFGRYSTDYCVACK